MLRFRCVSGGFFAIVALVGSPMGTAHAHGGPPRTRTIAFHPTDPDVWVSQTTFGLVRTDDGGATWRWVCPQAMRWDVGEDPVFLVTADGSTLGALFGGLTRGDADWCDWSFPEPDLERTVVIDVALDPGEPQRVLTVTSSGGDDNGVFVSRDGGRTWTPGPSLGRVLFESIDVAPSDPDRVYLSGVTLPRGNPDDPDYEPRTALVYGSADGGQTFPEARRHEVPLGTEDRAVEVLGVSPADPDVLFLHVRAREGDDQIFRSTDAGATFETVLRGEQIFSFAVSDDGTSAWASGLDVGLQRSTDGGETFSPVDADLDTRCLAYRAGDGLFACGNDNVDGFALGRSADGGESFEPVFRHADVGGLVPCGETTTTGDLCAAWVQDLCDDLELTADWCPDGEGGADAGPPPGTADAGPGDAAPGGSDGCRLGGSGARDGGLAGVLGLTALALLTGRRRRAPVLRGARRGAAGAARPPAVGPRRRSPRRRR